MFNRLPYFSLAGINNMLPSCYAYDFFLFYGYHLGYFLTANVCLNVAQNTLNHSLVLSIGYTYRAQFINN